MPFISFSTFKFLSLSQPCRHSHCTFQIAMKLKHHSMHKLYIRDTYILKSLNKVPSLPPQRKWHLQTEAFKGTRHEQRDSKSFHLFLSCFKVLCKALGEESKSNQVLALDVSLGVALDKGLGNSNPDGAWSFSGALVSLH